MSFAVLRSSRTPAPWLTELRACVALSWPLALTNAIEMVMGITTVAMIGRFSPTALAASTLGMALFNVFLLFGIGVTAAVSPLVARALGSGASHQTVRHIVHQGLWGAVIIAVPIWIVLWNTEPILLALGQDPVLSAAAAVYLHALQWAILPALVYLVLRSVFATLERPRWAVATGAMAVGLNALLNWVLIGGHCGAPALGLVGSGLATLLSNSFMAAALGVVALVDPRLRDMKLLSGLIRLPARGFGAFWRLGLPIGISLLLETGMFAAAAAMIGRFDAASLAAHAIALPVAALTFMVPLGIAQAATVRIGRASGMGDAAAVARAGWTALALGTATMVISATVLISVPRVIIGLFLDDAEAGAAAVEGVAVGLLGVAGLFQIADGAQVVLAGMLRGLQDTRAAMIIAALGYWGVGLPVGALLAFTFDLRAAGVWIGMTAGLFSVAAMLFARWQYRLRLAVRQQTYEVRAG